MDPDELRKEDPINLLTGLNWAEARGEDAIGKLAVSFTVDNRVRDPRWPNTYQGVILHHATLHNGRTVYQFSCFNPGDPNRKKLLNRLRPSCNSNWGDPIWLECRWAAQTVIGRLCQDITGGANHYHSRFVTASWSAGKTPCFEWGNHVFFKL